MKDTQPMIAHVRKSDGAIQLLEAHLRETADWSEQFAAVIGMRLCGRLLGLLHDLGKYSAEFQKYIRDVTGINGLTAQLDANNRTRKIDHATSGSQHIWDGYKSQTIPLPLAQILSVVIMSHHSRSGMKDFINLKGESPFLNRVNWSDSQTHKLESLTKADPLILKEINQILQSPELVKEYKTAIGNIKDSSPHRVPKHASVALLTRFLFSCLLDADRISTIDFENPRAASFRTLGTIPDWKKILSTFETHLSKLKPDSEINKIRCNISEECRAAATRPDNLFTLQVPTGGGKTLASLRFALQRAASDRTYRIERIIFILPYTTIIEQNAEELRKIFSKKGAEDIVLEHHSNLSQEKDSWRNRTLSENWDAPIVFTTSVQFLNALFASGTKTARRMHSLSNTILIFDEIQSLPIKTIHLFNTALNFLRQRANTTAVLCTATMPLLQKVNAELGSLPFTAKSSIISDKTNLFKNLKRTEIIDKCRPEGWSNIEVRDYALELQGLHRSLLIVCNTKNAARAIFEDLKAQTSTPIIHLSTNMCPVHRKYKITQLRTALDPKNPQPTICVSTQLIEAGVDLDFGCVIRSLAGLDSIVQAAGRCNRHGHRKIGNVYVLNFKEEILYAALKEIEKSQQITKDRIFLEYNNDPASFDNDVLSEKAMNQYYHYYFFQRAKEMSYPGKAGKGSPPLTEDCTLLSLLSLNLESVNVAHHIKNTGACQLPLRQAHSTASQAFQVIDAPTQGIIVPYDKDGHDGTRIIAELAASYTNENVSLAEQVHLHKQAQQYTVNAFPHVIKKLAKIGAIREIQSGEGIYYLDERHYHDDFGITHEALSEQHYLEVSK